MNVYSISSNRKPRPKVEEFGKGTPSMEKICSVDFLFFHPNWPFDLFCDLE
jgi:hypothetical protein